MLSVDPHRPPRPGDHVLVEMKPLHDGEPGPAYVKRLIATGPTKLRLAQYNPPSDKIELLREKVQRARITKLAELLGI